MIENEAAWKEAAVTRFNQLAPRFRARGLPTEEEMGWLLRMIDCPPGSLVLDAGCGAGNWSVALALRGYRVRGIDLSSEMLDEAKHLRDEQCLDDDQVRFEPGEAENISAKDEEFDAILCRCVLDFSPRPGVSLTEFRRVIRPGGRAVLVTLGAHSPVKREWWRRFLPDYVGGVYSNNILPWEMESLVTELGWTITEQFPFFGPSIEGVANEYTNESAQALGDTFLQQAVCSSWWMAVEKS